MKNRIDVFGILFLIAFLSCTREAKIKGGSYLAFTGGNIFTGTHDQWIKGGTLLVHEGRVVAAGPAGEIKVPHDAIIFDMKGKFIVPGFINSHGHVGDVKDNEPGHYSARNIRDQLETYAWYGITTVVSLGGDSEEAEPFRAVIDTAVAPGRARLYIAGTIITGNALAQADSVVDQDVKMGVDLIKIRVDDNLGTTKKIPENIYKAVIGRAHEHHLRLAVHLYYLHDAKSLLRDGADFIAHSIRDLPVDEEFIRLIREHQTGYCPTLTLDWSTFVYESTPEFFNDSFFLARVNPSVIKALENPKFQKKVQDSREARLYKVAMDRAMKNLKVLSDSGVVISMGTDSGMPGRFPGYSEHKEMEFMARSGMTPAQILIAATVNPARCLGLKDVGALEPGKLADFIIFEKDPLEDILNTRSISSVWIGGKPIPRK